MGWLNQTKYCHRPGASGSLRIPGTRGSSQPFVTLKLRAFSTSPLPCGGWAVASRRPRIRGHSFRWSSTVSTACGRTSRRSLGGEGHVLVAVKISPELPVSTACCGRYTGVRTKLCTLYTDLYNTRRYNRVRERGVNDGTASRTGGQTQLRLAAFEEANPKEHR